MKHSLELHILTTIVLVLFFLPSKAQEFTFSGAIVIDKTEVLSYTITYTITEENILTGFSISDLNGKEETKAQLTGKYNAKEKTLSFDEKKLSTLKAKHLRTSSA